METGHQSKKIVVATSQKEGKDILVFTEAQKIMQDLIAKFKAADYVDETSPYYIPIGVDAENWDFNTHTWTKPPVAGFVPDVPELEGLEEEKAEEGDILSILASAKGYRKIVADDYEGYFSGDVPDHAVSVFRNWIG